MDYYDLIREVETYCRELRWDATQMYNYLRSKYGCNWIYDMSDESLSEFRDFLQKLLRKQKAERTGEQPSPTLWD